MTTITIPTLETERLILRAPRISDFTTYADIFAHPRARYMNGPLKRDDAWNELAADLVGWLLLGFGYWTVETRESGEVAGMVGHAKPPVYPERELGWMVTPASEGKGIAREAAIAARNWAYGEKGWNTLVSYIDPENTRSRNLAETLGCEIDETAERPEPGCLVYRHPSPEALH